MQQKVEREARSRWGAASGSPMSTPRGGSSSDGGAATARARGPTLYRASPGQRIVAGHRVASFMGVLPREIWDPQGADGCRVTGQSQCGSLSAEAVAAVVAAAMGLAGGSGSGGGGDTAQQKQHQQQQRTAAGGRSRSVCSLAVEVLAASRPRTSASASASSPSAALDASADPPLRLRSHSSISSEASASGGGPRTSSANGSDLSSLRGGGGWPLSMSSPSTAVPGLGGGLEGTFASASAFSRSFGGASSRAQTPPEGDFIFAGDLRGTRLSPAPLWNDLQICSSAPPAGEAYEGSGGGGAGHAAHHRPHVASPSKQSITWATIWPTDTGAPPTSASSLTESACRSASVSGGHCGASSSESLWMRQLASGRHGHHKSVSGFSVFNRPSLLAMPGGDGVGMIGGGGGGGGGDGVVHPPTTEVPRNLDGTLGRKNEEKEAVRRAEAQAAIHALVTSHRPRAGTTDDGGGGAGPRQGKRMLGRSLSKSASFMTSAAADAAVDSPRSSLRGVLITAERAPAELKLGDNFSPALTGPDPRKVENMDDMVRIVSSRHLRRQESRMPAQRVLDANPHFQPTVSKKRLSQLTRC
jgi:hypothetical protein